MDSASTRQTLPHLTSRQSQISGFSSLSFLGWRQPCCKDFVEVELLQNSRQPGIECCTVVAHRRYGESIDGGLRWVQSACLVAAVAGSLGRATQSLMNNDQTKLICLGIISGCGLIASGLATRDAQATCSLVTVAFLIWFVVRFNSLKP